MLPLAIEVAHWSALVPLAYLALFRRGAPVAHWFVALAFAASFVGDTAAQIMGGSWAAEPYYLTVQYTLFAAAVFVDGARDVWPAVALYAFVGTALYLGMVRYATPEQSEAFMRWWPWYQGARLSAFALFLAAARRRVSNYADCKPC